MLSKVNPGLSDNLGLNLGESLEIKINEISNNLSWEQLLAFMRRFLEAYNDNKNPLISQLPLELAIVEVCYGIQKAAPGFSSCGLSSISGSKLSTSNKDAASVKPDKNQAEGKIAKNINEGEGASKAIINLDQAEVLEKWPEFLVKIKKYNHSLSFVLQNCHPQDVKDNCLCLIFKYKFHQDRINDATIKNIIETTLAEVFGAALTLSSLIDENLDLKREDKTEVVSQDVPVSAGAAETDIKKGGLINDLLKTFGGEIIN